MNGMSILALGSLLALAGTTASANAQKPAADRGAQIFKTCAGCHSLNGGRKTLLAPDLKGVVGRVVGSAAGFRYSPAMKKTGGIWTVQRLNQFLAAPAKTVPGTYMSFGGIPDPKERAAVIDFIKRAK